MNVSKDWRDFLSQLADKAWLRHANPWSVYTRFAAIPAMIAAIWSRVWIGYWSVAPIALVVVWLILNPVVFAPVQEPAHWISKGIYGERLWLRGGRIIKEHRLLLNGLALAGFVGLILIAWGLYSLNLLTCIVGASLTIVAQLWRIARFARVYDAAQLNQATLSEPSV